MSYNLHQVKVKSIFAKHITGKVQNTKFKLCDQWRHTITYIWLNRQSSWLTKTLSLIKESVHHVSPI